MKKKPIDSAQPISALPKIPFVDFGKEYRNIRPEILGEIDRVLKAGDLILRDDVEKFEENLAKFCGVKYAVGLNSGTDALFLALKALGIGKGDEVITSGYTFWATVEAIINCGAKPVLADIRTDLLIDPGDAGRKVTKRTRAIIPVHIGGAVCEMDKIMDIGYDNNLYVIEDSAQALGASKPFGEIQTYSFYPAKVLGAYGDGGAITTDNKEIADKIRLLRDHGRKTKHETVCVGYNSRLDNLQAAILNVKMKYLEKSLQRRHEIARIYEEELRGLPLVLPRSDTYQEFNITLFDRRSTRDDLYNFLKEIGIETLKGEYYFPIKQPMSAISANEQTLRLPIWPTLTDREIKYICQKIREFFFLRGHSQ